MIARPLTCVTVNVSPSTSTSLARTLIVNGPLSSAMVKLSGLATGASLTAVTEMVVVETAELRIPSFAVTVMTRFTVDGFSLVDE